MTLKSIGFWFKKHTEIWAVIFAIAISVLIFSFRGSLSNLQGYGYLGLFVMSVLGNATIILPIPVVLAAFLGGGLFNPLLVALTVAIGATLGELTGYLAGYGGQALINGDKRIQKVKKWIDAYGLWALFVLAAIPNPLFDLGGMVAGATKISVYKYMIAVGAGKFVKFLAFSYLGAGVFAKIAG